MLFQMISSPNRHYGIYNALTEWLRRDFGRAASDDCDQRLSAGHTQVAARSSVLAPLTHRVDLGTVVRERSHVIVAWITVSPSFAP
jgi:hypothetical protein